MIETHHLSKFYSRGLYALRDLSLTIAKGEFVFLAGPSGAGKSTFLRLLLMQERPSEGEIFVNGDSLNGLSRREIQEHRRGIGFVFQDFKLISTRTVLENVSFVSQVLGEPSAQRRRRAFQVLKWVGLQHRMHAYPLDLSGGEQQRVAIARALVNDPGLLLADEPTGNLDPDLSLEIMNLLREVNAGGTTVLVATHDRELIRLVGPPHDYARRRAGGRSRMRALGYALREGWASLWRGRGSSAIAIVAIALAIIVLGSLLLVTWNVERLLAQWTSATELSVYLRDEATSEQRGAIEAVIDDSGVADGREYVSKVDALARFRREFAELASLATGFDDNPFPASVEVLVRPDAENDGRADALVRQVTMLPGVADVRYDREWLARIASGLSAVSGIGFALAMLMALAAAVTVASVVRLGLQARRNEIEIMQLVGSPIAFIRGPFVAEGVIQGGIGALVALGCLGLGFAVAGAWWGAELGALLDGDSVQFLQARFCVSLVAGGMMVGGAGGFAAARRAAPHEPVALTPARPRR